MHGHASPGRRAAIVLAVDLIRKREVGEQHAFDFTRESVVDGQHHDLEIEAKGAVVEICAADGRADIVDEHDL